MRDLGRALQRAVDVQGARGREKSHRDSLAQALLLGGQLGHALPTAERAIRCTLTRQPWPAARLPRRPRRGRRRVVVGLDALVDLLQVGPQLVDRRAAPEPVADVDLLDPQARRRGSACAARRRGRGAGRCTRRCRARAAPRGRRRRGTSSARRSAIRILKMSCRSLGSTVTSCGEGHRAPLVELDHLALVLALARAVLAAAEHAAPWQLSPCSSDSRCSVAVLVGQLEVGQRRAGLEVLAHGLLLGSRHARDVEPDPVDAGQRGDVERAAVGVAPGEVVRVLGQRAAVPRRSPSGEMIQTPPGPQT